MDYKIELYRGEDSKIFGTESFMSIVRESLEYMLGKELKNVSLKIQIQNIPEDFFGGANGVPIVENMVPEFGYLIIQVFQNQQLIYQHPHSMQDLVTNTLQMRLKRKYPGEIFWRFRINAPGMPRESHIRRAPNVERGIHITKSQSEEKGRLSIRRIEETAPPSIKINKFGIERIPEKDWTSNLKVIVPAQIHKDLCENRPFSTLVEEGGFLLGRVFKDKEMYEGYILELTDAVEARYTGASFLHFTFTGDSFVEVKKTLWNDKSGVRMLGWYHTHLFPATPEFGLSSIDFRLHFNTFTFPWQLAGLINLDRVGRTLRFYAAKDNNMILVPFYIV